ncbi:MAG: MFS transporter [bacterium]
MSPRGPDESRTGRFARTGHSRPHRRNDDPPPPSSGPGPVEDDGYSAPSLYAGGGHPAPAESGWDERSWNGRSEIPGQTTGPLRRADSPQPLPLGATRAPAVPGREPHPTRGIPVDADATAGGASAGADPPKVTVTRAVAQRSQQAVSTVARKVVAASRADGADRSGLTPLIWNQVMSFGADAMITVALAGTVFFSAAQSDQKGNVLGYLLITMAPFAIVAPIIGPALDRLQHGRRWAMAGSALGRAILAVLMAQNFTNLLLLFPLALGSLVLSKAYSVVRAAAAPRVVPPAMSLVSANSRLSIFGLGAAFLGGGFIAAVIKLTGSYSLGLWITAVAFAVTAFYALRLPAQVDSATPARRHPEEPDRPRRVQRVGSIERIRQWAGRGFDPKLITSLQGASLLRWASGFLTMFLAFYIERTAHGLDAAIDLGGIAFAVGLGSLVGTAAGARLSFPHPDVLVMACACASAAVCVFTALTFSIVTAMICMLVSGAANSLGKLALDSVVQRDVDETLRSSAFARSETFLQLAWVVGATVALLLPADRGQLGLSVAAAFLGGSTIFVILRSRAMGRATRRSPGTAPGTV